ncbi:MAG: hypothetical protein WCA20_02575 [Candidatus Sulfotelmatobacter sp.]
MLQRRYPEAIGAFEQAGIRPRVHLLGPGAGTSLSGARDYDKALAAQSKSIRAAGINYFWLGAAYAVRGDKETALATLRKAFGFHDLAALDTSPYFSSLRTDRRFRQLTQRYRE